MRDVEDHVHIHFEMASFSQSSLIQDLIDDVIPYADSLGMNEQVRNFNYPLQMYCIGIFYFPTQCRAYKGITLTCRLRFSGNLR